MKPLLVAIIIFHCGTGWAQDPWKNIYSQHAWAARDKWQRSDELIRLLNISVGDRVADVGCHEGYMTFKLARVVGEKGVVYAVDLQQAKLDKVSKRASDNGIPQIKVVKGQDDNPKLPENSLDAVVILDTYHEMDAHTKMLQHLKASLKSGGRLLLCEPIADSRKNLSRDEQEQKHELAMAFALSDLQAAGFRIVYQKDNFIDRTKEKGDRMWVVVGEKI
jgi:ubiquinone/menaquinone biosynthesis C-methylase UbiE